MRFKSCRGSAFLQAILKNVTNVELLRHQNPSVLSSVEKDNMTFINVSGPFKSPTNIALGHTLILF